MKKFITYIFCFVAVCLLLVSIPSWYFEHLAHKETNRSPYSRVNKVYGLKDSDADLIILGNSRAEKSYNDSLISKLLGINCVNIGWGGYPFDYQYHVMFKTYMKQNKPPKYILQEIGPWAFFDYVNPKYIVEILPYLSRPEFSFYIEMNPELSPSDKLFLVRYAGKFSKIMEQIDSLKSISIPKQKSTGFKKNYFKTYRELEKDSHLILLFQQYIEECKKQGIKLIFICSPMHTKEGAAFFDMKGFWKLIKKITLNQDIPILNYQDYYGNDTTYFADPMHLNDYGKDCFSRVVANALDSLISH